jgi:hypothetical protein
MLIQLVYYSRNLLKRAPDGRESELVKILKSSQKNNSALGLTGALMFNQHVFAQVLEGERAKLSSLLLRIVNDPRHADVTIVEAQPIESRMFGEWSMTLIEHSDIDQNTAPGGFAPQAMTGTQIVRGMLDLLHRQKLSISVAVPLV